MEDLTGETSPGIFACTSEQLEELLERHPWFTGARLLLWQRSGELSTLLQLRQQFRPSPDFLLKTQDTKRFDRIEKFLTKAPSRIVPSTDSAPNKNLAEESITEDPDLISEELAEIYAKQGLYPKANAIYAKLSLLYPEKSVYFAEIIAGFNAKGALRKLKTEKV